ncbi:ABC transporter permease [Fontimonas sp. SYSU GA230001]|uniref:ABC transporter permease n=1 Tax=Fontimonas sp. SYSU GA230001 TaxID=3142450 RepID=UPI0032B33110
MHGFVALCRKELLLLSRDRHGLLVLFAVPTLFILLMSLALRDAFRADAALGLPLTIIDRDGGHLAQDFAAALLRSGAFVVQDRADVRVIVHAGFSELLATRNELAADFRGGEPEPALIDVEISPGVPPQIKAAASLAVRQALLAVQSEFLLEHVLATPPDERDNLRYLTDPRHLPVMERFVGSDGTTIEAPTSVQQNVPAWLIFAMFFAVIPLATAFVIERSEGSLLRLRALGVRGGVLLASKALPYYLVNLTQMVLMLAIGVWIVPLLGGDRLTLGDSPFGLWLIGSATSLAAIGLALCVAVAVRSTLQATVAGGAISLLLAAVGGVMVPKMVMPDTMQALTRLSPMAWSLEGFWDIVLRRGGWREALPEALALSAFGLVCLGLAALQLRRSETTMHRTP